ncbi:DUF2986 domain-containing protein [Photobacterium atrarenae]|uniref:DUF2986 domain-containing protein n=1 Tax=Photobacterium atrarenae TaxID=865757 RepID=A0ABY5GIW8_9GAMM|nr:DUF2986 domain-containing protein [Photobacterium atrarenae]UTV28878.1 DUF2986 domain-containing protein [Photobacterium atrarenae]
MNRKKKINETLKKKQKKQNAKLHRSNKPRYISKAERAKMAAEGAEQQPAEDQAAESQTETPVAPSAEQAAD